VTQLFSRHYQPRLVRCRVTGAGGAPGGSGGASPLTLLDVNAKRSQDGKTLVLQAVNPTGRPVPAEIRLSGYGPSKNEAQVTELSGALAAKNTAARPAAVVPQERRWPHGLKDGKASYTFPPCSVTVIKWE
jgi:alpha-L-arabinofuranosidase